MFFIQNKQPYRHYKIQNARTIGKTYVDQEGPFHSAILTVKTLGLF